MDGEDRMFPPKTVQEPSGNLGLTLECDTVCGVRRSWKDSKTRTVESVVDGVRRTSIRLVQRSRETREERPVAAERRAEEERLRRDREEQRRLEEERRRLEQKRVEALLGKAADWIQADQLRRSAVAFCDAASQHVSERLDRGDEELLRWIDSVAVDLDPLTHGLDAVKSATDPWSFSIGRFQR